MQISNEERARLKSLYLKAAYEVQYPHSASSFCIEVGTNHPQLDEYLAPTESWMFMTAYEPMGQKYSTRRNRLAQQRLLREADKKEKKLWTGLGYDLRSDADWEEPSALIFPVTKTEAFDWAHRYRQLAILFGSRGQKAQLLFTR